MEVQMHRENLVIALSLAIAEQERIDKSKGLTGDSGFAAGWKQVLDVVKQGGNIKFFEDGK